MNIKGKTICAQLKKLDSVSSKQFKLMTWAQRERHREEYDRIERLVLLSHFLFVRGQISQIVKNDYLKLKTPIELTNEYVSDFGHRIDFENAGFGKWESGNDYHFDYPLTHEFEYWVFRQFVYEFNLIESNTLELCFQQ